MIDKSLDVNIIPLRIEFYVVVKSWIFDLMRSDMNKTKMHRRIENSRTSLFYFERIE